jgi:hypothetical protein
VTWRASIISEKERRLTQLIEYELFSPENVSTAHSVEELTLYWFNDAELGVYAKNAGLKIDQTLTSFGPEAGRQRIYVLRRPA